MSSNYTFAKLNNRKKITKVHNSFTSRDEKDDPNKIIISYDTVINRLNHTKPDLTPKIANIPLGGKKGQKKTELQQYELLIKNKPQTAKVRKFFKKYVDRINYEEASQQGFKGYLKDTV